VVFNDGGNDIDFRIEGDTSSSLFFVDASTDRVGIGTTSPAEILNIAGSGASSTPTIRIDATNSDGTVAGRTAIQAIGGGAGSTESSLAFQTRNSGGTLGERARIDSSGRLLVGTTTATANGGVLELSGGITFPATAVAASNANTLDDYEEGTFTPVVYGTTTAGAGTYTTQVGAYTKIGNVVHVTIALSWTAHTGTGSIRISGLPFANGTVSSAGSTLTIRATGLSLSVDNTLIGAQVPDGDTYIIIHEYPVGGGAISGVDMDTNASIWLSGHYFL